MEGTSIACIFLVPTDHILLLCCRVKKLADQGKQWVKLACSVHRICGYYQHCNICMVIKSAQTVVIMTLMLLAILPCTDEMQTLLLGPEANGLDDSGACYRRSDLVELETALVAHWLRCLLRYVIEIEALDLSALNKSQLLTLHSSLFTLQQSLLPSMQLLLKTLYLVDRMQLLPTPTSMVFKTVGLRVNKLLNDAQSTSE